MAFDVFGLGAWIDTRADTGHRRAASWIQLVPFSYWSIWSQGKTDFFSTELVAGKPISTGSLAFSLFQSFDEWQAYAPANSGGWYPDW